jgi:hypothetical protein
MSLYACLTFAAVSLHVIRVTLVDGAVSSVPPPPSPFTFLTDPQTSVWPVIAALALSVAAMTLCGAMAVFHLYLILNDLTNKSYFRGENGDASRGRFRRFLDVFGSRPLLWFLPLPSAS